MYSQFGLFIDGHWTLGTVSGEVISPVTEKPLGRVAHATVEDTQAALDAAARALPKLREMGGFDPATMQELNLTAVFAPSLTPSQETTLARLEHLLSLAEGWISAVSARAVISQLPHAVALGEMFQRRSATSSPINQVFGPLVGLELKPRKVREAATFWRMALDRLGMEGRDRLWSHPDLLPTPEQLEKPETFFEEHTPSDVEAELDAFLEELLSGGSGSTGYRYGSKGYYLVYRPVGFQELTIVGIVERDVVDAGMRPVGIVSRTDIINAFGVMQ